MKREEIEKALQGLPREKVVAFAVRVALRMLPMLVRYGQDGVPELTCWEPQDRARHLLAVFAACNVGVLRVQGEEKAAAADNAYVADAAYAAYASADAADAADTSDAAYAAAAYAAADAAADAADAAADAADADADAYADAAAYAAAAAARAMRSNPAIEAEISQDLKAIKTLNLISFVQIPLWTTSANTQSKQRFNALKAAALALDAGFEYWFDWLEDRYAGRELDTDLQINSTQIPQAVRAQGVAAINAYLQQLKQGNITAPLNRVRAIFIGNGDAGKTSLVRVLHGEPVAENEAMTPGIDIREWPVPDTDIMAHFWDFGGQVMAHATHQLFLRESCLYVLVMASRSEINATEQAEYWLEHVKSFGRGAPVMIVGNKVEQVALNLDMGALKQKYPNIIDFYPLSCMQVHGSHQSHFDVFRQAFTRQLQAVGTHQMLFTKAQFAVLQALRKLTQESNFLKHTQFDDLCAEHGVSEQGTQNRAWLLDILDKLGVIVHFPAMEFLDEYVLNPRWLTYGVYTLMYSHRSHLPERDIVRILGQTTASDEAGHSLHYPKNRCRLIMDAMRQFKLCYSLPGQPDTIIIPALLPASTPDFSFDKSTALAFEFAFAGFVPRHILPELIVVRHTEIVDSIAWQHGVVLRHAKLEAQALVQVDYHLRKLLFWVSGRQARDYLTLLREDIDKMLGKLVLDCQQRLGLPHATCLTPEKLRHGQEEQAPFARILEHELQGMPIYLSDSGARYDVAKVLTRFLPDDAHEQERARAIQINLHNSSIHGGLIAAGKLHDSFNRQAGLAPAEPDADDPVMSLARLVQQLLKEIETLQRRTVPEQRVQVQNMLQDAQTILTESMRDKPRKAQYGISLEGILAQAQNLKHAGGVVELAQQVQQVVRAGD